MSTTPRPDEAAGRLEFVMAGGTDIGHHRDQNEDCYGLELLTGAAWAVVADGLGGHLGGEVASEYATARLTECFLESLAWGPESAVEALMEAAFRRTHAALNDHGEAHHRVFGMGTTLTAVYLEAVTEQLVMGHVGDSRYYQWHRDHLMQLTDDHNLAGRLLREDPGCRPSWQAYHSLERAVGANQPYDPPQVRRHGIRRGDKLLLCTDGLSGKLSDDRIQAILSREETDPQDEVDELIQAALAQGADDNVTALVIHIR